MKAVVWAVLMLLGIIVVFVGLTIGDRTHVVDAVGILFGGSLIVIAGWRLIRTLATTGSK